MESQLWYDLIVKNGVQAHNLTYKLNVIDVLSHPLFENTNKKKMKTYVLFFITNTLRQQI